MREVWNPKIAEDGGPAENWWGGSGVPVVCRGLDGQMFYPWELHLSGGAVERFLCVAFDRELVNEGEAERERNKAIGCAFVGFRGEIGIAEVWSGDVGEEMPQYAHFWIIPYKFSKEGQHDGRLVVACTNGIGCVVNEWREVGEY